MYRKRTVIWPFYFYTIIRTLSYNLAIIIGSLIILCILISRGYDIYVILIPILTILASLINLICDIKKHK
ncbi:hypothetical protein P7765_14665 [Staphylococcus aureus]|nr:hypothetical protein [Staphylococcus aureus]MDM6522001.1 hypothetical protein [Staphylococcus aureus]MDM6699276.1 hypothetical protein [Staphylococcus aureus]